MAKIWRNRIEAGDQLFSNCPERYRQDVLAYMQEDVEEGRLTQEQYDELISK